ncbi:IS3 family transposase [Lactiplantibacillus sp. DA1]|uniref:IS3 family transposase n=1 Tax=Lactiplantibacillus sp. DA1 TaxID=3079857 RepID=UPI00292A6300|nr:IS3 family transposase [Lactiplantibacillus sp. DA1]MDV0431185.1 IS3 family transposase [Lactiplantibacillus sp. DA1]
MPRSRYSAVEKLVLITEFQNSNLRRDPEVTESVALKQVKRIMNKLGIRCQVRQKKRSRIQQQEQYLQDNVLDQQFNASRPNQAWLADSTELVYDVNGQYKMRLSGVLDLYGRHLIAHKLSESKTSNAEIQIFQRAVNFAGDVHPLVHTDRGSAYTSRAFNQFLIQHEVTRSMSRPGTPYDNAPMERWWNEFKVRWIERRARPATYKELVALVEEGITYFNQLGRSPAGNDLTPVEYWNKAV